MNETLDGQRDSNIPDQIVLYYHKGCFRGHWTMSEVRKCVGHFVHYDQLRIVTYVRENL